MGSAAATPRSAAQRLVTPQVPLLTLLCYLREMKVFFMFPASRRVASAETNGGSSSLLSPQLCPVDSLSLPAEMISIWGALQGWRGFDAIGFTAKQNYIFKIS